MRGLPRDHRGFVVPRFVRWIDGVPDFRITDTAFFVRAIKERLCWLCGRKLGRHLAFVIGPMCALTRTTSEPPSHLECARYAVQVCPFLSRPKMRRNDTNWPEPQRWAPGLTIDRNPGVSAIWVTAGYKMFEPGNGGVLITVGDPSSIEWWREGRPATRAECQESIDSGLPILRANAEHEDAQWPPRAADDPRSARYALERNYVSRLDALLPPEDADDYRPEGWSPGVAQAMGVFNEGMAKRRRDDDNTP
jgi:hypothetical protein